jgi:putative transposase
MPRQRRLFVPDVPQHVITRGNDRQVVFFHRRDYGYYLKALRKAAADCGCQVHAYVLMTNHVHLLVTPERKASLPLMMQAMGRTYVQPLNLRYQRTGHLWEGRYKASLVETNEYLLACQRYIELNPVRAGMVRAPGDYPFSSYRCHALGVDDPLLTPHPVYLALHASPAGRRRAYRNLFRDALSDELLVQMRRSTNACGIIGSGTFREQIVASLGRAVSTGKRGRPPKPPGKRGLSPLKEAAQLREERAPGRLMREQQVVGGIEGDEARVGNAGGDAPPLVERHRHVVA